MYKMSVGEKFFHGIIVIFLIATALIMLLPFVNLLAVSFSGAKEVVNKEITLWPKGLQFETYKFVISSPQMIRSLVNSIYITVIGTFISVILTTFLGYGLSKKTVLIRALVIQLVVFTMLFKPGIIPTYLVVRAAGLIDSRWALMIPVAISPFNLIIMKSFFQNMPEELEESAIIEGAGYATIFFKIVVPLSMAGIATITLFYAVARWNTFYDAVMYLNDMKKHPLQVALREIIILGTSMEQSSSMESSIKDIPEQNLKAAVIMFATFPILILYPYLQKHFVKGVMIGGIKG